MGAEDVSLSPDVFERRLVQEMSAVRIDLAGLRRELKSDIAVVRQEIADKRFELLEWSYLFWIGQVVAIAGILSVMLRTVAQH